MMKKIDLNNATLKDVAKEYARLSEEYKELKSYMDDLSTFIKDKTQGTTNIKISNEQYIAVTATNDSVVVDTAKVKCLSNWEKRFGKTKRGYLSVSVKNF